MNEPPMIRCRPTLSDAELEAQRDVKHAKEVKEWFDHQARIDAELDHIPPQAVQG